MKKKVFGAVALIAIAVAAGWNYQQSQQESELSDLTLVPDFVNAYPKTHQRIMARYVDAVSSA